MKNEEKAIYSYHTFMLPFIIKNEENKKSVIKNWNLDTYKACYNEESYFHGFFKDSMFNSSNNSEFYTRKEYSNTKFIVKKRKEYNLLLENINLRIFDTGIGVLTFNIINNDYEDVKSILEINDYARRIYPEYLDNEQKCSLLPEYIKLHDISENFIYKEEDTKPTISKIITKLIGNEITPAIDDRMFTLCYYNNSKISDELKTDYENHDKWYEYVFIDGAGKTVQNKKMQAKLMEKATYPRWQESGTMYGMSKYSFVCLTNAGFPLKHMQTIYFSMFSLLLMVRATILKFSSEVSSIAVKLEDKSTSEKVTDLYENYIKFVNKFYFREITAKDQGLELYEQAIDIFKIERDIKDLDSELEELHKYIELKEKKKSEKELEKTNRNLEILAYIGGALVLPSILTGFFGMNIIEFIPENHTVNELAIYIILSALCLPIGLFIKDKFFKKENHE